MSLLPLFSGLLIIFSWLQTSPYIDFTRPTLSLQDDFVSIGGWMLNEKQVITSYRSSTTYRLTLEKIKRRDENGTAITTLQDQMDFPLDGTDYISRGENYCSSKKNYPNLVVLINRKGPYKAWRIYKSKFKEVSIKEVYCELDEDDGN